MRFVLVFIGIAFTTFVVLAAIGGGGQSEVAKSCRDGSINADAIIDSWKKAGVVRSVSKSERNAVVSVDTARWGMIERNAKITIGIAAYCAITDNTGKGFVAVKGNQMEPLGSVVDGNWMR